MDLEVKKIINDDLLFIDFREGGGVSLSVSVYYFYRETDCLSDKTDL